MLALDLVDRRTMWRDYWIEWGLAAVLLAANEWLQWRLAALVGARVPVLAVVPAFVISLCTFPVVANRQIRAPELPLSRRNAARKFLSRPKPP